MGVYIPNMGMPEREEDCKFFDTDILGVRKPYCAINSVCNGLDDCPLIELPPHGRLIDADAILYETRDCDICDGDKITERIYDAPTIIEAEESE